MEKMPSENPNSRRNFLKKMGILGAGMAAGPMMSKAANLVDKVSNLGTEKISSSSERVFKIDLGNAFESGATSIRNGEQSGIVAALKQAFKELAQSTDGQSLQDILRDPSFEFTIAVGADPDPIEMGNYNLCKERAASVKELVVEVYTWLTEEADVSPEVATRALDNIYYDIPKGDPDAGVERGVATPQEMAARVEDFDQLPSEKQKNAQRYVEFELRKANLPTTTYFERISPEKIWKYCFLG